MTQAIRDAVVDFVRYWSRHPEILLDRLLTWCGPVRSDGIPSSKYYDWRKRYGQDNRHNAQLPRGHWLLDWEKAAILAYQREHPEEGYRRLAYMMLDADVVTASPSSIYRVLKEEGRLGKDTSCPSSKGRWVRATQRPA